MTARYGLEQNATVNVCADIDAKSANRTVMDNAGRTLSCAAATRICNDAMLPNRTVSVHGIRGNYIMVYVILHFTPNRFAAPSLSKRSSFVEVIASICIPFAANHQSLDTNAIFKGD